MPIDSQERAARRLATVAIMGSALVGLLGTPAASLAQDGPGTAESREAGHDVVDPEASLRHFYTRLRAAERGEQDAIARVMVYSESTNAADRVTSALRRLLQHRFGDAGKGWVPISPGWPYQRHRDVEWSQEGRWRTWVVNRHDGPLGRYGLGGVVATNRHQSARAYFGTSSSGPIGRSVSRYRLFYQAYPEGGDVSLRVDGAGPVTVSTRSDNVEDRVHDLRIADGAHRLELAPAGGDLRLYGVVMERERPGVVVDGLMLVGAFTRVLLHFDPDHWRRQVELRQPDLMVFWLGGNDAISRTSGFSRQRYTRQYAEAVRRARRGRPRASCVIMSVLDAAEEVDGAIRTRRRIPRVVRAQRDVARETRCAFFDLFGATGGEGTMRRWRRSSPRLAQGDYKHLTRAGAQEVGQTVYRALMRGYDRHAASGR